MKIILFLCVTFVFSFNLTEPIDRLFARWNSENSPGASVMIIKDGNVIFQKGYGSASLDFKVPISDKTVFPVASVSKQFTCMCIALLQEEGKLNVTDDVRKYIPEIPDYGHKITIDHLIRHTSGLREMYVITSLAGEGDLYLRDVNWHLNLVFRQKKLIFLPGEKYSYCNTGYLLMAEIIRRVSGLDIADYAKKHIFDKLDMKLSHFKKNHRLIVKNLAQPYVATGNDWKKAFYIVDLPGGGGLQMPISEFLEWDKNFYKNRLGKGSPDLIRQTVMPGRLNNGDVNPYGFGLFLTPGNVYHMGSWEGVATLFARYIQAKVTIVIFSNAGNMPVQDLERSIATLMGIKSVDFPVETLEEHHHGFLGEIQPSRDVGLQEYVGYYYSRELLNTYHMMMDDGKLSFEIRMQGKFFLQRVSGDLFRFAMGTIHFARNNGKISSFKISVSSVTDIEFVKTTKKPICE